MTQNKYRPIFGLTFSCILLALFFSSCNIIYLYADFGDRTLERKVNRKFGRDFKMKIEDTTLVMISYLKDTLKINRSELLEENAVAYCVPERVILFRLKEGVHKQKKEKYGILTTKEGYECYFTLNKRKRRLMKASEILSSVVYHLNCKHIGTTKK